MEAEERDRFLSKKVMELYVLQSPFFDGKKDPERVVQLRRDIFKVLREGADPNVRNDFGRLLLLYVLDERVALAFASTGRLTEEVKREYLDKIDEDLQVRWIKRYTSARKMVEPVISVVSRSLEEPQKKQKTRYVHSPQTLKGQVSLLLLNGWAKREIKTTEYPQVSRSGETLLGLAEHGIKQNFYLITKKMEEHIIKHVSLTDAPVQNKLGITPLMCAVNQGNKDGVQLLLDWGMSPDVKNAYGETALMYAAQKGDVECLRTLMKKSKNFKEKAGDGSRYKGLDAVDVLAVNTTAMDFHVFLEKLAQTFPYEEKYFLEKEERFKKLGSRVRTMMHKMALARKKDKNQVLNKPFFMDKGR